ncbi:MAG: hypothetical protein K0R51_470 [Cytophagaceae bacterium]|jgi:hypothetical protein|nr:hypothetical protein [Cytophagaceae bacterium]
MRKKNTLVLFTTSFLIVLLLNNACKRNDSEEVKPDTVKKSTRMSASYYQQLALRWAPIHHQDVDNSGCGSMSGRGDYITNINFDNDWITSNNWNNIEPSKGFVPKGHSYYSVVETGTHYYIIYSFFHPRDWAEVCFANMDYHENDLEGLLAIVKKSTANNGYGELQGIVTNAHADFYSFVPSGSPLQSNKESIDGALKLENYNNELHPVTAQECRGHGLKAQPYYKINGDGLIYLPSLITAEAPANNDDRNVMYKLVDIFESGGMWERRFDAQSFKENGRAFLRTVGSGGAHTPWGWDDKDDLPGVGELATDPARLANIYFKNFGSIDLNYVYNPYRGIY